MHARTIYVSKDSCEVFIIYNRFSDDLCGDVCMVILTLIMFKNLLECFLLTFYFVVLLLTKMK